jgi:hypothetical protein
MSRKRNGDISGSDSSLATTEIENGVAVPKEDKAVKFKRLANRRVPAALRRMQHVQNLANRAQYLYTRDEAIKLINLFKNAINKMSLAFEGNDPIIPENLF